MFFEKWEEPPAGHVFYFPDRSSGSRVVERAFRASTWKDPEPRIEVEIGEFPVAIDLSGDGNTRSALTSDDLACGVRVNLALQIPGDWDKLEDAIEFVARGESPRMNMRVVVQKARAARHVETDLASVVLAEVRKVTCVSLFKTTNGVSNLEAAIARAVGSHIDGIKTHGGSPIFRRLSDPDVRVIRKKPDPKEYSINIAVAAEWTEFEKSETDAVNQQALAAEKARLEQDNQMQRLGKEKGAEQKAWELARANADNATEQQLQDAATETAKIKHKAAKGREEFDLDAFTEASKRRRALKDQQEAKDFAAVVHSQKMEEARTNIELEGQRGTLATAVLARAETEASALKAARFAEAEALEHEKKAERAGELVVQEAYFKALPEILQGLFKPAETLKDVRLINISGFPGPNQENIGGHPLASVIGNLSLLPVLREVMNALRPDGGPDDNRNM